MYAILAFLDADFDLPWMELLGETAVLRFRVKPTCPWGKLRVGGHLMIRTSDLYRKFILIIGSKELIAAKNV